ncbi:MAG: hypothetical protein HGA45_28690, partial [Chloroflexales bacterium]|nr:hypothetical protein [Chloroflexales bacterium]
ANDLLEGLGAGAPALAEAVKHPGSLSAEDSALTQGPDDEPPFADPFYWAPFVLTLSGGRG